MLPDDTVETLHERIKDVERRLYPETIRELIEASERADEGAALRLRQDRPRRAWPRACTSSAGELVSCGGTAAAIAEAGIPVTDVDDVTGVARDARRTGSMTLHPKIHGGILADRGKPDAPAPTSSATASSRSTSWCRTSTRSRADPSIETDRHRRARR